ncbi:hypothetical protein [Arthrobacter ulcerisalmonis]|uniref:hypothetical protein n=1 Tax=Arthrobacter ulcerisalmonis TaxID=2483813 RepID=UPI0036391B46
MDRCVSLAEEILDVGTIGHHGGFAPVPQKIRSQHRAAIGFADGSPLIGIFVSELDEAHAGLIGRPRQVKPESPDSAAKRTVDGVGCHQWT